MMRRTASELRPGVLDHPGLPAATEWQAADFQKRTGIPVRKRARLLGGEVTITGVAARGATVTARVPREWRTEGD
jgi:signal transduction histidine kinase